ncbi:MAG: hypothetical protein GY952_15560, partial [Rhodobacteraceae bacterium]|nr:hypothetical protein [Paracoccaceae bacterium]
MERSAEERGERDWPGRVFEDDQRDYAQAMLDYVAASQAQTNRETRTPKPSETVSLKAQKRALRQEEDRLRLERRAIRQQRAQEDTAWKTLKEQRRPERAAQKHRTGAERKAQDERWRTLRDQRHATLQHREAEDAHWRAQRRSLRSRSDRLPLVTAWIAILVMTDNCTRQCLGLPLFVAGAPVT